MELVPLLYVPLALGAGLAFHYVVFADRAQNRQPAKLRRRWLSVVLPLSCLLVWVVLCYGFKLRTWAPFSGDAPGSVALTNALMLAGAALTGLWISVRLRRE